MQAIRTAPFTAQAQFGDRKSMESLKRPADDFPFLQGFWHYARGVTLAQNGDIAGARAEAKAIDDLTAKADFSMLEKQFLPAKTVMGIASDVLEARIAQGEKDYAKAETHLRKAIEQEAAIPYTEPPFWYYPVSQTLGAVQLQQGKAKEAADTFQQTLSKTPRNAWALWGLMEAQAKTGDAAHKDTEASFAKAWLGDRALLVLDRL